MGQMASLCSGTNSTEPSAYSMTTTSHVNKYLAIPLPCYCCDVAVRLGGTHTSQAIVPISSERKRCTFSCAGVLGGRTATLSTVIAPKISLMVTFSPKSRAKQGKARQGRAKRSGAEQSRAEQSGVERSRAEQNRAEHSGAKQSEAKQRKA